MASPPCLKHSVSRSLSDKNHGRSKAQMCLKKIIDIILSPSLQPCKISKGSSLNPIFESEAKGSREKTGAFCLGELGFNIDLNLRLGPALETKESKHLTENEGFSACSGVGKADGKVCGIIVDCNSSAVSGDVSTVEKSSEGECYPKDGGNSSGDCLAIEANREEREVVEEETREFSEITNLQARSSEIETKRVYEETEDGEQSEIKAEEKQQDDEEEEELEDGEEEKLRRKEYKSEGYLGLLVEAARLISGNFDDDEEEEEEQEPEKPNRNDRLREDAKEETLGTTETETETKESIRSRSKRNRCWMLDFYGDFEDISPVVRSKRGRNQVLPYRYRDSVLEPWKRLSRQRSSGVSAKPRTN